VLATKAGFFDYASPPDYSPAAIERSLQISLKRLGTDYVDLLQLHSPPTETLRLHPEIVDRLVNLRERGLVRALGFSASSPADAVAAIRLFDFDAVQVNLNMLDIRALECGLFEAARAAGTSIVARTPLCFGFLSGKIAADTEFPSADHRNRWNGPQVTRWAEAAKTVLALAGAGHGQTPVQAALRFCLSFPEVCVVIPGITTSDEASENAEASDLGPLAAKAIDAILEFHARNDVVLSGGVTGMPINA
jgi:aryl-alcohol dehydrogenase-like predicted oxidoreductase